MPVLRVVYYRTSDGVNNGAPHLPADGQGGVALLPVEALLHRPAALLHHELLDLLDGIRLEVVRSLLEYCDQILAKTRMKYLNPRIGFAFSARPSSISPMDFMVYSQLIPV